MNVFLACDGDGSDGDDWRVFGVFTSRAQAEEFIKAHNSHRPAWAKLRVEDIEEWPLDKAFDPREYPHDKPKQKE